MQFEFKNQQDQSRHRAQQHRQRERRVQVPLPNARELKAGAHQRFAGILLTVVWKRLGVLLPQRGIGPDRHHDPAPY